MGNDASTKPFADWLGRVFVSEDDVTARLVESYRAIFDPNLSPASDGAAPLGIHWCLSPAIAPMAQLGPDGHPAKNLTMPPIPLPLRMWAGGEVEHLGALRTGDHVTKRSTIETVSHKHGRSGELWFVSLRHEYATERGVAIRERQDIVYRANAAPTSKPKSDAMIEEQPPAGGICTVDTPPTLLFRYSAITFNGHRIHYDLPYATEVEGYEGLVVHGPLQATLLLNVAAASAGTVPGRFLYRGLRPAIAGRPIAVKRGDGEATETYWTEGAGGIRHMEASIRQA